MNAERPGGPEKPDESVVERNFGMLMAHVKSPDTAESISGNASKVIIDGESWGCYAINGVIDARTGQIVEYGNYVQATNLDQEEFGIIIAVPPVQLLLKGVSDVMMEIRPHTNCFLSPGSIETLMRMKPLWDAHSTAASTKYMAAYKPPAKPVADADAPATEAVNDVTFIDRFRRLFGR